MDVNIICYGCKTLNAIVYLKQQKKLNINFVLDEQRVRSGVWEEQPCEKRVTPSLIHTRNLHHHNHTISHRSTDNSWCSESDPELSSDEESDRSAASSTR